MTPKENAKLLYCEGKSVPFIAKKVKRSRATIYNWIREGNWISPFDGETILQAAQKRLFALIHRDNKTRSDNAEIDKMMKIIERLEKIELQKEKLKLQLEKQNDAADQQARSSGRKKKRKNNYFGDVDPAEVEEKLLSGLFNYQVELWEHRTERIRNILKSRQIGATYYFAAEAFADALMTGHNQIFLSASRNQADIFRGYIRGFARKWFDCELKGKDTIEIVTPKGVATLYFLSTNSATAQSYTGNVYIDEYFWIPKFDLLNKVAGAIATHKRWRKTYFSTPSAKSHSAFPFWNMDPHNDKLKKRNKPLIPFPETEELKKGISCPDGQWRKLITIYDAEAGGCDLFDIEQLKLEYSDDEFNQLFCCEFIDDTDSVFKLSELERCIGDSSTWKDFKKNSASPYKYPVWIGYDPSRNRDGACIVVVAPPRRVNGKFRVLERIRLFNTAWQFQAAVIKELTDKYDVDYIGIDITGPGSGVYEMVENFFPRATAIFYSMQKKTELVLKGVQVVNDNRVEWDAEYSDIAAGFMQIHKSVTANGHIVYAANRSDIAGHADSAWAILHVLINEGFLTPDLQKKTTVVIG